METTEVGNSNENMRLRDAFMHWLVCLAIFITLASLGAYFDSIFFGYPAFFFYIAAGIYLNRKILRNLVEWHPMHNTLNNVTSDKTKFFLFWPINYLALFIKLGANKVL